MGRRDWFVELLRSLGGFVVSCVPAVPFSFLPIVAALNRQAPSFPPDAAILIRAFIIAAGCTMVICLILRGVGCSPRTIATAVALGSGIFSLYSPVRQLIVPAVFAQGSSLLGFSYLAACFLIPAGILRLRSANVPALYDAVRGVAFLITAVALLQVVRWYGPATATDGLENSVPQELASLTSSQAGARPDVYHLILDGFGRPDVLQAMYGLDLSSTVHELEDRGFQVAEGNGTANYVQTYLSLASMLNMSYLDPLAERFADAQSRVPLHRLIQRSSVIAAFKRLGYDIHFIGSIYSATQGHRLADECHCDYPLVGEFESLIVHGTPFVDIGFAGLDYRPHRNKLRRSFEALESLPAVTKPRFVLAHVMAPHPPFVYDAEGQEVYPARIFSLFDGTGYGGTEEDYAVGYGAQARYVVRRLSRVLDRFEALAVEQGREFVIIVHGDHGPRSRFDALDATRTDANESLPVLLAIRWSAGDPGSEQRVTSLVNIYRVFFRRYFKITLEPLPDRAFLSSFLTPYGFVEVDSRRIAR